MANFRGFRLALRGRILHDRRVDLSSLTCRASLAGDGEEPLCGERAAWLLTAACPHEHIVPSLGCDRHAEDARKRGTTCYGCRNGREPHSCPVTIEFRRLAAAAEAS
jgi:hypothetical protein